MRVSHVGRLSRTKGATLCVVPVSEAGVARNGALRSPLMKGASRTVGPNPGAQLKRRGWAPKPGTAFLFPDTRGSGPDVQVVGFAPGGDPCDQARAFYELGMDSARAARGLHASRLAIEAPHGLDAGRYVEQFLTGALQVPLDRQKPSGEIESLELLGRWGYSDGALQRAEAMAAGVRWARELIMMPANVLYPDSMARMAYDTLNDSDVGMRVEVMRGDEVRTCYPLLHAVGRAAQHQPVMIKISYDPPGAKGKPLGLVGKGLCMDTGGYYTKPFPAMHFMIGDMGGAAAVLGAMLAIKMLQPNQAVVAFIPAAINAISGDAMFNGDVITSRSGKRVRIIHSDAEGRLVLADAITALQELGVRGIIDIATLTGAQVVALGDEMGALFSTHARFGKQVRLAGVCSGEMLWKLPMEGRYRKMLDAPSNVADIANLSTAGAPQPAGSIMGALFLKEFVDPSIPFVHLDVAGPALRGLDKGDVPGFGVQTLARVVCG